MTAVLVVSFCACLLLAMPVAFAMIVSSILAIWAGGNVPIALIAQRLGSGIDNFTYLAIPLFIFAGRLMEETGMSERLVRLARALVGHIPGGLGQTVVVTDIFFSGLSGSTLADASAVASLTFPGMRRAGYSDVRATSIIVAAGAIGILFPPCLTMVVIGALLGISISSLFLSGLLPGLFMALMLMATIFVQARSGVIPLAQSVFSGAELWAALRGSLVPAMMPAIIFGGIFGGIFSPTEAAAVAVLYAFVVGFFIYRKITLKQTWHLLIQTGLTTAAIGFVLAAAIVIATLMGLQGIPTTIVRYVSEVTTQPLVFLVLANTIFLIFGALLDGIPALLLFLPILMPAAKAFGIDPLHFALTAIASLGVGIILPPLGIMLLIICAITKTPVMQVSRQMLPYFAILCFCLLCIIAVPWFVLVLPRAFGY
jgi:tripartite ATP-independent transporter DctM subunit